mmetsp:Transcript_40416/g.64802  ORF Transcript_40416/g.64802 Transcript_40416/m.64802 type:complete len:244 (+) Transcript_40416:775-1506(+)
MQCIESLRKYHLHVIVNRLDIHFVVAAVLILLRLILLRLFLVLFVMTILMEKHSVFQYFQNETNIKPRDNIRLFLRQTVHSLHLIPRTLLVLNYQRNVRRQIVQFGRSHFQKRFEFMHVETLFLLQSVQKRFHPLLIDAFLLHHRIRHQRRIHGVFRFVKQNQFCSVIQPHTRRLLQRHFLTVFIVAALFFIVAACIFHGTRIFKQILFTISLLQQLLHLVVESHHVADFRLILVEFAMLDER